MKAYDIVDKRSGQEKVEDSVREMISRQDIIIARNAAFVAYCKATNDNKDNDTINFLSGKMHALDQLL